MCSSGFDDFAWVDSGLRFRTLPRASSFGNLDPLNRPDELYVPYIPPVGYLVDDELKF